MLGRHRVYYVAEGDVLAEALSLLEAAAEIPKKLGKICKELFGKKCFQFERQETFEYVTVTRFKITDPEIVSGLKKAIRPFPYIVVRPRSGEPEKDWYEPNLRSGAGRELAEKLKVKWPKWQDYIKVPGLSAIDNRLIGDRFIRLGVWRVGSKVIISGGKPARKFNPPPQLVPLTYGEFELLREKEGDVRV